MYFILIKDIKIGCYIIYESIIFNLNIYKSRYNNKGGITKSCHKGCHVWLTGTVLLAHSSSTYRYRMIHLSHEYSGYLFSVFLITKSGMEDILVHAFA